MIDGFALLAGAILRLFQSRRRLLLENLALRQQLAALKRRHPRPRLAAFDKLFWVLARRIWFGWKQALIVVSPETVVRWHRSGFAVYWRAISKARRMVVICRAISPTFPGLVLTKTWAFISRSLRRCQVCCFSLQLRQWCVQGTAFNRALEMGCPQVTQTPYVPCFTRTNAPSIARRRRPSV